MEGSKLGQRRQDHLRRVQKPLSLDKDDKAKEQVRE
jgi:hypothetical protein